MMSYQISVSASRRAAARFVGKVRRSLQMAFAEANAKSGITQSDIAKKLGVHRSVIHRQLRGAEDITLSRVAELAWALGLTPYFGVKDPSGREGANTHDDSFHSIPEPTWRTEADSGNAAVDMTIPAPRAVAA